MNVFLARRIQRSVIGIGTPPEAGTRNKPTCWTPKTMTSSWFQAPGPQLPAKSATVCGVPPVASILLSLPPDGYAMKRPSGDQKGTPPMVVKSRDSPDSRK